MRNSSVIRKILKCTGSIVITLLVLEGYLRGTEVILPSYVYDNDVLGRTHKPGALVNEIDEGFYMGRVNDLGYVGPAYSERRQDESLRIALIGDSFVEGYQLFEQYHFRTVLENRLSQQLNRKVKVLNFGIGGIDFRDMFLIFQKSAIRYSPDVVLFFIRKDHLLTDNVLPTPQAYIDGHDVKFRSVDSPELQLRQRFKLVRNFALGTLSKEMFEAYYRGNLLAKMFPLVFPKTEVEATRKTLVVESQGSDRFYEMNNKILGVLSHARSGKVCEVIIVESDRLPGYYDEVISRYGLTTLALFQELDKYSKMDLQYWKGSGIIGHWNHRANEIVGVYLANQLSSLDALGRIPVRGSAGK
jgi:hypothetical protein